MNCTVIWHLFWRLSTDPRVAHLWAVGVDCSSTIDLSELAFQVGKALTHLAGLFLHQDFNRLLIDWPRVRDAVKFRCTLDVYVEHLTDNNYYYMYCLVFTHDFHCSHLGTLEWIWSMRQLCINNLPTVITQLKSVDSDFIPDHQTDRADSIPLD